MRYLTKIRVSKQRRGEGKEEKRTKAVAGTFKGWDGETGKQEAGEGTSQRQTEKGAYAVWKAKEGSF